MNMQTDSIESNTRKRNIDDVAEPAEQHLGRKIGRDAAAAAAAENVGENHSSSTSVPATSADENKEVPVPVAVTQEGEDSSQKKHSSPVTTTATATNNTYDNISHKDETTSSESSKKKGKKNKTEEHIDVIHNGTTITQTATKEFYPPFSNSAMVHPPVSAADADVLMIGMSQSERKRYREKKRRSEITTAMDQLTKILLKVEPAHLYQQNNLVYSTKSTTDFPSSRSGRPYDNSGGQQPLNRTEIINHSSQALERLFSENEEMKIQLMRLRSDINAVSGQGGATGVGNHQMMMFRQPIMYQSNSSPSQSKMTRPGPAASPAFVNGTIPMQQMMQTHPSFVHPSSFQVTSSSCGGLGAPAPGKNSIGVQNSANMMMQSSGAGTKNSHQRVLEQQLYLTQQILGLSDKGMSIC